MCTPSSSCTPVQHGRAITWAGLATPPPSLAPEPSFIAVAWLCMLQNRCCIESGAPVCCRRLFEELGEVGSFEQQGVCKHFLDQVDPTVR